MPAEMTSRQRVLAALSHQEPDRVPLDIGGGNSTSLLVETYENLKDHLGVSSTTRIANKAFRIAALDEECALIDTRSRPLFTAHQGRTGEAES